MYPGPGRDGWVYWNIGSRDDIKQPDTLKNRCCLELSNRADSLPTNNRQHAAPLPITGGYLA